MTKLFVYLLVLIVGTYVLGFILNLVSIYTPPAASYVFCPAGMHLQYSWEQTTWDHPGEKSLGGTCIDAQGNPHPKLPDDQLTPREFRIFMPPSFVIVLLFLVGWEIRSQFRNRRPATAN